MYKRNPARPHHIPLPPGRIPNPEVIAIFKCCVKTILIIPSVLIVFYTVFVLCGGGIYLCGGREEKVSLRILASFGGASSARNIAGVISGQMPCDSCCNSCQIDALTAICRRRPEEKENIIDFAVNEILKSNQLHKNRVDLILAIESLTGQSFSRSGFPMTSWYDHEIPEEEKPNIERGLKYIREWHEKRRASQGRQK